MFVFEYVFVYAFVGTIPNFANEKEPKRNFCGQVQNRVPVLRFYSFFPIWSWLLLFCLNIVFWWTRWSEDDFVCLTCVPSSWARVALLKSLSSLRHSQCSFHKAKHRLNLYHSPHVSGIFWNLLIIFRFCQYVAILTFGKSVVSSESGNSWESDDSLAIMVNLTFPLNPVILVYIMFLMNLVIFLKIIALVVLVKVVTQLILVILLILLILVNLVILLILRELFHWCSFSHFHSDRLKNMYFVF